MIGFPLRDQNTVGGSYLLLLDEGTELVAREFTREAVNELGTAGISRKVNPAGLQVLEGFAPTLQKHAQNIICEKQIDFSASLLSEFHVPGFRFQVAAALLGTLNIELGTGIYATQIIA